MATGLFGQNYVEGPYTFEAQEAIGRGYAVKMKVGGKLVELCDAAGEASYGIAIESKAVGEAIAVLKRGRFDKAVAGAALATLYVRLAVTTAGKYVAATTGNKVVGVNLSTASADLDTFEIELWDSESVI